METGSRLWKKLYLYSNSEKTKTKDSKHQTVEVALSEELNPQLLQCRELCSVANSVCMSVKQGFAEKAPPGPPCKPDVNLSVIYSG